MRDELIDTLTRTFAAPTPRRFVWRAVAATATATFGALLGRTLAQPESAIAAVSPGCLLLNHDATCPDNTVKRTQPGNVPTTNGCGPEGGDIKIPQGYGSADYTGSCNAHDVCYEECSTAKESCDDSFFNDMVASCAASYPGALNSLLRFGCYERAYVYYQAVYQFGGDAWTAAQKKACECCSQLKMYCECNKTCYDDVSTCLDECHVSLGCFSGICGPASAEQCPL